MSLAVCSMTRLQFLHNLIVQTALCMVHKLPLAMHPLIPNYIIPHFVIDSTSSSPLVHCFSKHVSPQPPMSPSILPPLCTKHNHPNYTYLIETIDPGTLETDPCARSRQRTLFDCVALCVVRTHMMRNHIAVGCVMSRSWAHVTMRRWSVFMHGQCCASCGFDYLYCVYVDASAIVRG
jgi:hypothetical protein